MKPEAHGGDRLRMAALAGRAPDSLLDICASMASARRSSRSLKIQFAYETGYVAWREGIGTRWSSKQYR